MGSRWEAAEDARFLAARLEGPTTDQERAQVVAFAVSVLRGAALDCEDGWDPPQVCEGLCASLRRHLGAL